MNYAETLAYWYLRLNGFFPLTQFVLHRDDRQLEIRDRCAADTDLLGIRLPNVTERVGTEDVDLDDRLFNTFAIDRGADITALIVQVKGGGNEGNPDRAFTEPRLRDAVNRFGDLRPGFDRNAAVTALRDGTHYHDRDRRAFVGKLAVVHTFDDGADEPRAIGTDYYGVSLRHINRFINERFTRHHVRKRGDWTHFPDDLIQYLIWKDDLA